MIKVRQLLIAHCKVAVFGAILVGSSFNLAASTRSEFTFEQLAKMAFRQNLSLKISDRQHQVSDLNEQVAFRQLLPAASINSSRNDTLQYTSDPANELTSYSTTLRLTQPIYAPSTWASWKKSKLTKKRNAKSLQKQKQTLLFQLKSAWYDLLKEQILNKQAHESLARLKQHRQNAEAFYASGKIWRNDVLQAQVRVSRGEQDVFAANNRLVLAKSRINTLLNRSITLPLNPVGELKWRDFETPFEQLVKQAAINRLEIKQSEIDIAIAKYDRDIAESKRLPSVNLTISSGATASHFDYQRSVTQTIASLSVNWNFWAWGQTNKEVDAADAQIQIENLALQQQKMEVLSEVQAAYLTVMESKKSLAVSEQALKQSEENFRVSQIRYKEQLGSSNDVLDAQDLLTQTQSSRVTALSRYLTAIAELDLAVGKGVQY